MLAQRQRELYSQQHRQRQLMQQRAILMRQQSFGNNLPPSTGLPVQIGAARLPQAPPQQFPYPPNYGTTPGNPPTSTSPFSPLASNPEAALANRSSMVNRGMMGSVAGQFGAGMTPQMQQNIFQYSGSGTARGGWWEVGRWWGGREGRAEPPTPRMQQPRSPHLSTWASSTSPGDLFWLNPPKKKLTVGEKFHSSGLKKQAASKLCSLKYTCPVKALAEQGGTRASHLLGRHRAPLRRVVRRWALS